MEKCSYAHRRVDERPSKRTKTNDAKSAVATLKKNDLQESIRLEDFWNRLWPNRLWPNRVLIVCKDCFLGVNCLGFLKLIVCFFLCVELSWVGREGGVPWTPRSGSPKGGGSKGGGSKGGGPKSGEAKTSHFFFFDRGFSFLLQDTIQNLKVRRLVR